MSKFSSKLNEDESSSDIGEPIKKKLIMEKTPISILTELCKQKVK